MILVHVDMKCELKEERGQHREELLGKMKTLERQLLGELLSICLLSVHEWVRPC